MVKEQLVSVKGKPVQQSNCANFTSIDLLLGHKMTVKDIKLPFVCLIIRLQAVVERAKQVSQTQAAVYQNCVALNYLLNEKSKVCEKFCLQNECCLQINDHGKVVTQLVKNMKWLAHIPVQKWNSVLQKP